MNQIRTFFNSKKGKEILEQNEKDLKEEFRTNTGMFSPVEDKAWEYLKFSEEFKKDLPSFLESIRENRAVLRRLGEENDI